jgi:phenylacetate-coenzyme A ligase PaaK-like adenylate-forming protein
MDQAGYITATKLYGGGTPAIRYIGLDDIVVPAEKKCNCNLNTQIISQIHGRKTDLVILPNGERLSTYSLTGIPRKTMDDLKTYKIKQFQIIQHRINKIEILVVINNKLRNVGPSVDKILKELKKRFSEKIGSDVEIIINEIDKIQTETSGEPAKLIISKVKQF